MKVGQQVKFLGGGGKSPVEKTFIWAVSHDNSSYLIMHPDGVLLTEETKDQFGTALKLPQSAFGKKFISALPEELQKTGEDISTNNEPKSEETEHEYTQEELDEIIDIKLPRSIWFSIINASTNYAESFKQQRAIIKATHQLTDDQIDEMISDCTKFLSESNKIHIK